MSTGYNSEVSSIHLLKNCDTEDNPDVDKLLKPVDDLELDLDSDYSDIPDIFEEFHMGSFLRPNADPRKKHLSKPEADWKTVESFTDDFRKTMGQVRDELQINQPLFEEEQAVEEVLNKPHVPNNLIGAKADSPIPIECDKDQVSETSSQSLVWQRLLRNSDGRFKVSPPIFDAFRQQEKHWLERPSVSWKLVDDCRIKCEKWLDDVTQGEGEY